MMTKLTTYSDLKSPRKWLALPTALLVAALTPDAAPGPTVPNFSLVDVDDHNHELHRTPGRAVVLFFTGTGCLIVRKNAAKFRAL